MPTLQITTHSTSSHPHADAEEMARVAEHAKAFMTAAAPALVHQMEAEANKDHVAKAGGKKTTPFTLSPTVVVETKIVP